MMCLNEISDFWTSIFQHSHFLKNKDKYVTNQLTSSNLIKLARKIILENNQSGDRF